MTTGIPATAGTVTTGIPATAGAVTTGVPATTGVGDGTAVRSRAISATNAGSTAGTVGVDFAADLNHIVGCSPFLTLDNNEKNKSFSATSRQSKKFSDNSLILRPPPHGR